MNASNRGFVFSIAMYLHSAISNRIPLPIACFHYQSKLGTKRLASQFCIHYPPCSRTADFSSLFAPARRTLSMNFWIVRISLPGFCNLELPIHVSSLSLRQPRRITENFNLAFQNKILLLHRLFETVNKNAINWKKNGCQFITRLTKQIVLLFDSQIIRLYFSLPW